MFSAFLDILGTDVDHGAPNGLCRRDKNVVVFSHLEGIDLFAGPGLVQNTNVNRLWDRIVDEFTKNQTITAFIKELHGGCGDRQSATNVRIAFEHRVNVIRELGSFILVDRMANICVRSLDGDLACLSGEATGRGRGLHFRVEL